MVQTTNLLPFIVGYTSDTGVTGLKSRCQQGLHTLLEVLGKDLFPCTFWLFAKFCLLQLQDWDPASLLAVTEGHSQLPEASPFLVAASSIFCVSISPSLSSLFKQGKVLHLCWLHWSDWAHLDNPGYSPLLGVLHHNPPHKVLFQDWVSSWKHEYLWRIIILSITASIIILEWITIFF